MKNPFIFWHGRACAKRASGLSIPAPAFAARAPDNLYPEQRKCNRFSFFKLCSPYGGGESRSGKSEAAPLAGIFKGERAAHAGKSAGCRPSPSRASRAAPTSAARNTEADVRPIFPDRPFRRAFGAAKPAPQGPCPQAVRKTCFRRRPMQGTELSGNGTEALRTRPGSPRRRIGRSRPEASSR